ncbi:hypothetical protein ASPCADRAFT_209620 [Aspergillus carbonarius ITEM 5010]|uniref:Uncharacterized protein n=1 Tax=Aspergillus carbonarius (strain ITEM 5010) TaxID=602072 RepID=A0A1R3RER7_ASPC5|nr:hypothetical protein ASPCADRAFT_209620 [Aspergillus carbonarius ITEM 5010]
MKWICPNWLSTHVRPKLNHLTPVIIHLRRRKQVGSSAFTGDGMDNRDGSGFRH